MISHLADPRHPRDVAHKIIQRGERLGDADMVRRGQRLMEHADQVERAQRSLMRDVETSRDVRPSDHDVVIQHDRFECSSATEAAYTWGVCLGFAAMAFYIGVLVFGLWNTGLFVLGSALVVGTGYATYAAVRRARE